MVRNGGMWGKEVKLNVPGKTLAVIVKTKMFQ